MDRRRDARRGCQAVASASNLPRLRLSGCLPQREDACRPGKMARPECGLQFSALTGTSLSTARRNSRPRAPRHVRVLQCVARSHRRDVWNRLHDSLRVASPRLRYNRRLPGPAQAERVRMDRRALPTDSDIVHSVRLSDRT